ncbi:MAG TPA: DUF6694 family lipoprotein [Wenzhouxiangella sp.]|nr:DUF6694 family lipoprotein [Wenzhouxiangella sp.]
MIRGTTTVLLAALFLALVACSGGTRLDASSDEAMYESMTAIQEELPADQRAEFDEALQIVIASQVDFSELEGMENPEKAIEEKIRKAIHGKSASQIIAMADKVKNR